MSRARLEQDNAQQTASPLGVAADGVVRACFDLTVLTGAILNDIQGKPFGVRQQLLKYVMQNRSPVNGVQLIVSASMLTHLARNLEAKLLTWNRRHTNDDRSFAPAIQESIQAIEELVALGPHREGPVVFFGPSHVEPSADADPEDAHVLTTALRAGAHVLVSDDGHFIDPTRSIMGRMSAWPSDPSVFLYHDADRRLLIVPSTRFAEWHRTPTEALPHLPPRTPEPLLRRPLFPQTRPPSPGASESSDDTPVPHDAPDASPTPWGRGAVKIVEDSARDQTPPLPDAPPKI